MWPGCSYWSPSKKSVCRKCNQEKQKNNHPFERTLVGIGHECRQKRASCCPYLGKIIRNYTFIRIPPCGPPRCNDEPLISSPLSTPPLQCWGCLWRPSPNPAGTTLKRRGLRGKAMNLQFRIIFPKYGKHWGVFPTSLKPGLYEKKSTRRSPVWV